MLLIRFSHKFGRGLLSSPDFYCTTGISVLQGDSQIGFQSKEANDSCPECGEACDGLQLHTVYFSPDVLDRYTSKHFVVLCPTCHEQAHS